MDKKIHELFEKNRKFFDGLPVAFDGVVDEQRYIDSEYKIAFLLKDINGEEKIIEDDTKKTKMMDSDWEYMEWLRKDTLNYKKNIYKTWPNVCLWLEVFRKPNVTYTDCLNDSGNFDEKRQRIFVAFSVIV